MNIVFDWFAGLATIGGFLYFLLGFAAAYATHCIKAVWRHKEITMPWHIAGIAIGIVAIVFVAFQTQIAYTTAKDTAQEVQDCQREFNQALRNRSQITMENDELSQEQRQIVFRWIHGLLFPPPPYQARLDDPARQDYNLRLTLQAEREFSESLLRQDVLQKQREHNPLPDPTCGK